MTKITIALAGNPNAGKSTIFNALTGLHQHTGNWPGKTVEIKSGTRVVDGIAVEIVDLPGSYSLSPYSPDEAVARDFLLSAHPDVVICVVDATNLERNLYLVIQLLEMGLPMVLGVNMIDQARATGIEIDLRRLSESLANTPVVPTAANKGSGVDQLLSTAVIQAQMHSSENCVASPSCHCSKPATFKVEYNDGIEQAIEEITRLLTDHNIPLNGFCSRWLALKLLEREPAVKIEIEAFADGKLITRTATERNVQLEEQLGDDLEILTADQRYMLVNTISRQSQVQRGPSIISLTERIDTIVTDRRFGLPIFLLVMFIVFRLVTDVSAPYLDWIDSVISGPLARWISSSLTLIGISGWFHSLVIDGIVTGVGGVLTFVPGLIVLFFFLDLLEESGYMARAAFVMDRFMQIIGLHGKSVIPLILGFGCAVPAIYSTRTIANRRDRLLTALLIPFMSCSARLPVYFVFVMAFFARQAGTVIWLLYLLGIIVAILVGAVLSRTVLKVGEEAAFVMELPPYRLPTFKSLSVHTWMNTRHFIKNAGTVILGMSIILWLLLNLPWGVEEQKDSYFGEMSAAISPLLEPAGFGSYEASGALISGIVAKEMVVSSLSQIYLSAESNENININNPSFRQAAGEIAVGFGLATVDSAKTLISLIPGVNLMAESVVENTSLSRALQQNFTSLSAVAFLIFVLLYVPCVATIGALKQEFGSRWAASAAVYQTLIAWIFAVLVFQGGRLLGVA